jgi:hypothetical protein
MRAACSKIQPNALATGRCVQNHGGHTSKRKRKALRACDAQRFLLQKWVDACMGARARRVRTRTHPVYPELVVVYELRDTLIPLTPPLNTTMAVAAATTVARQAWTLCRLAIVTPCVATTRAAREHCDSPTGFVHTHTPLVREGLSVHCGGEHSTLSVLSLCVRARMRVSYHEFDMDKRCDEIPTAARRYNKGWTTTWAGSRTTKGLVGSHDRSVCKPWPSRPVSEFALSLKKRERKANFKDDSCASTSILPSHLIYAFIMLFPTHMLVR